MSSVPEVPLSALSEDDLFKLAEAALVLLPKWRQMQLMPHRDSIVARIEAEGGVADYSVWVGLMALLWPRAPGDNTSYKIPPRLLKRAEYEEAKAITVAGYEPSHYNSKAEHRSIMASHAETHTQLLRDILDELQRR
jgi:hypothetical protein